MGKEKTGWRDVFRAVKEAAVGSKDSIVGRIGANRARIERLEAEVETLKERCRLLENAVARSRRPAKKKA